MTDFAFKLTSKLVVKPSITLNSCPTQIGRWPSGLRLEISVTGNRSLASGMTVIAVIVVNGAALAASMLLLLLLLNISHRQMVQRTNRMMTVHHFS